MAVKRQRLVLCRLVKDEHADLRVCNFNRLSRLVCCLAGQSLNHYDKTN